MPALVESYQPTPKQEAFHAHAAKYRLALGGYGSSKTTLAVWEDITLAMEYPGSTGVFYRKTYPALRDTSMRSYLEECPTQLIKQFVRSEGKEALHFVNGSTTVFRCLDDFLKLGSTQWDRVSIDEAGEVGEREFRTLAFGRLRGKIGPRRLMAYSNPVDDLHWLHKFFVDNAEGDTTVFHFSTYDNAAHLPEGYIERLEKMTPAEKRMFIHGQWGVVAAGPAMFPSFNELIHVGDFRPMRNRLIRRGWDPGRVHAACVWVQSDVLGNEVVLHELLGDNEDAVAFGTRVMQESDRLFPGEPFEDYCDIAGHQRHDTGPSWASVMRKRWGLAPHCRKLSIAKTWQGVTDLLNGLGMNGYPRLRFNRTCRKLIRGMAGGLFIEPSTGEPHRKNQYIHLFDALRYVLAPVISPARSLYEGRPLPNRWRLQSV